MAEAFDPSLHGGSRLSDLECIVEDQNLAVLKGIVQVFEDLAQRSNTKSGAKIWIEQLRDVTDAAEETKIMHSLLAVLHRLELHDSRAFGTATRALADGSRYESWRSPLSMFFLDFYLDLVAKGGEQPCIIDALRLIGNCCIDSDANRDRVLERLHIDSLLDRLESTELEAGVVLGVLYNLCLDYEPAQRAAKTHGLFPRILYMIRAGLLTDRDMLGRAYKLLDLAIDEVDMSSCPEDAIRLIYDTIAIVDPDLDDVVSLCNLIIALLASERYQKLTIARGEVALITTLFVFTYTQDITTLRNSDFTSAIQFDQHIGEPEHEETMSGLRLALTACLWDISAQPTFALFADSSPDLLHMLRRWLSRPQTQMQLCACSIFRNLTISHEATDNIIRQTQVNGALVDIMRSSSDVQVLEEALRLYRNLAVHPDYRILLARGEAMDTITALWSKIPVRVVQYAAVRVVRQLLTGQDHNVTQFLTTKPQKSEDPSSSDTYVARLLRLYSSTTDLATRMEVGQTVVAIWRVRGYQGDATASGPVIWDNAIHQAEQIDINIAEPIMALITDSENTSLVTQGWLGLALMAGTPKGCIAVAAVLCIAGNREVFQRTLREQEEGSTTKDGNNATILLALLRKNQPALPQELADLGATSAPREIAPC